MRGVVIGVPVATILWLLGIGAVDALDSPASAARFALDLGAVMVALVVLGLIVVGLLAKGQQFFHHLRHKLKPVARGEYLPGHTRVGIDDRDVVALAPRERPRA